MLRDEGERDEERDEREGCDKELVVLISSAAEWRDRVHTRVRADSGGADGRSRRASLRRGRDGAGLEGADMADCSGMLLSRQRNVARGHAGLFVCKEIH